MSHMQHQIEEGDWYVVETNVGTECVPADLCTVDLDVDDPDLSPLKDYCEGTRLISAELCHGFGARLSAPGYLDCTEWGVYDTLEEAKQALDDMYGDEDLGPDDRIIRAGFMLASDLDCTHDLACAILGAIIDTEARDQALALSRCEDAPDQT